MAPLAIAAATIALVTLWNDNHRLRDELDAALAALGTSRNVLNGIASLASFTADGQTIDSASAEPPSASPRDCDPAR